MARELSVGRVAKRCGLPVSTLHFYERKRLIRSFRTAGNQRRYRGDVLRRLSVIKFAQDLGIALAEIRSALESLPVDRAPTRADWEILLREWGGLLDQRILRLQRLRSSLASCIGCGCLSLDHCAIYNPQDKLSEMGPGPRKLISEEAAE